MPYVLEYSRVICTSTLNYLYHDVTPSINYFGIYMVQLLLSTYIFLPCMSNKITFCYEKSLEQFLSIRHDSYTHNIDFISLFIGQVCPYLSETIGIIPLSLVYSSGRFYLTLSHFHGLSFNVQFFRYYKQPQDLFLTVLYIVFLKYGWNLLDSLCSLKKIQLSIKLSHGNSLKKKIPHNI